MAWEMGFWPCLSGIMVVKLTEVGDSFQLWVRPFLDEMLGLYNMVKGSCARQPSWLCFPPDNGCDVASYSKLLQPWLPTMEDPTLPLRTRTNPHGYGEIN